jgi:hypothetical protein
LEFEAKSAAAWDPAAPLRVSGAWNIGAEPGFGAGLFKAPDHSTEKLDLRFRRLFSHGVDKAIGLKYDQTVVLTPLLPGRVHRVRVAIRVYLRFQVFLDY